MVQFLKDFLHNAQEKIKERQDYIRKKKLLISHLTIPECEKLYKTYINKELKKVVRDPQQDYKEKKIDLSIKEIKRSIYWSLSCDQIVETVQRLKKYI